MCMRGLKFELYKNSEHKILIITGYILYENHKLTPIRTPEERPLTKGPDTQVSNEHLILVYKTTHQQDHSY